MLIDRRMFLSLAVGAAATPALAFDDRAGGRIETLPGLGKASLPRSRIRVWLPPRFPEAGRRYRTLYMLDGQYAFAGDSDGTNYAADRRVARLMGAGRIPPTLIVAIDNLEGDRFLQYMPQTIYDRAGGGVRDTVEREMKRVGKDALVSAPFIRFLATELKPFVDAKYKTSTNRLDTAIFGASMAGVMAGAIFVEAPQSFGRGACMSPNWPIYDQHMIDHAGLPAIWATYFAQLGRPAGRRLWLDHGTQMMDAGMAPHQSAIAERLTSLGWRRGRNLRTEVYQAGHAFAQTATQMDDVLAWLLA
jgi:enterochelin esterase-like enzyme